MNESFVLDNLLRYVGQTVTIFTTSGGISGSGFTGVLAGISNCTIKLITDIGAAPACPVGSCCDSGCGNGCGYGNGYGNGYGYGNGNGFFGFGYSNYGYGNATAGCGCNNYCGSILGSVTEIPIDKIASFVHNAI
jgi:hypothetical protein